MKISKRPATVKPSIAVSIDHHDWFAIEKLLGSTLSSTVRRYLIEATNMYASSLDAQKDTAALAEVLRQISKWQDASKKLKAFIVTNGKKPKTLLPDAQRKARLLWAYEFIAQGGDYEAVIDGVLSRPRSEIEAQYPLLLLDRILDGVLHVSMLVQLDLEDSLDTGDRKWLIWAALILSILRNASVPTHHPKRKKLLYGPVMLLVRLQMKLPREQHARRLPDQNYLHRGEIPESFWKGARIAWKICENCSKEEILKGILARWARGENLTVFDDAERQVIHRLNERHFRKIRN